jgi:hypothetical protein
MWTSRNPGQVGLQVSILKLAFDVNVIGAETHLMLHIKQDCKGFQSLAANIFVKLVPTFINTYLVSQIPICKMESQILALKKAIGISNTNWYFNE